MSSDTNQHSEPDYSPAGTFEALRSEVARDPHRMSMMLSAPSARVLLDEYDRLRGVVETLTGRNQFLSTEQIRADLAEARIKELEEQLETANRDREALAAGIGEWLGSQGYSAAERAELFSSFLDSNPASRPES